MSEELKPCWYCGHKLEKRTLEDGEIYYECKCDWLDFSTLDPVGFKKEYNSAWCWKEIEKLKAENETLLWTCGFLAQHMIDDPAIKATPDKDGWVKKGKEFYLKLKAELAAEKEKVGKLRKTMEEIIRFDNPTKSLRVEIFQDKAKEILKETEEK